MAFSLCLLLLNLDSIKFHLVNKFISLLVILLVIYYVNYFFKGVSETAFN